MNGKRSGWLLPTAICAYVATAAQEQPSGWSLLGYLAPVLLAASLFWLGSLRPPKKLADSVPRLRLLVLGVAFFVAASWGPEDHPWLKAIAGLGQGLVVAAALLAIARLPEPDGLLKSPRAAVSLDAVVVVSVLWFLTAFLSLSRAILPELTDVPPPTIDTAFLFAALGSLLLLVAVLIRTRLLRGLQLGVADRASAGLWLAVCGASIGAGSGFLQTATADRVSGITLVITSCAVSYCMVDPSAARVSRISRGGIALLLLGAPTTLLGAELALSHPERPVTITLGVSALSMICGVVSYRVARPLGPAGSRWLEALTRAMAAALHPDPDLALRGALTALAKAESAKDQRPELFRFDPPSLISVDIAGYLTERPIEFPARVFELAKDEPGATLRHATVVRAQVRRPDVRPLVAWFGAHSAKSATALADSDGPVGLLKMPEGARRSALTMEEVELLSDLAERLTGVVSVTSALARAHQRQLSAQGRAELAEARARELEHHLFDQRNAGRLDAEMRAEVVLTTAHGAASQMALSEIRRLARQPVVRLHVPPGGDGVAWAACLHLERGKEGGFVVVDCSARRARTAGFFNGAAPDSPLARLQPGTLVLLGTSDVLEQEWSELRLRARGSDVTLVVCGSFLDAESEPPLRIPSLEARAEDLASLINFQLSRLGLLGRGRPLGIERSALALLLDRPYPGNEAELLGILEAACATCPTDQVTLGDLERVYEPSEGAAREPLSSDRDEAPRRRFRPAPRSRRPGP